MSEGGPFIELHPAAGFWRIPGSLDSIETLRPEFSLDGGFPARLPSWHPVRVTVDPGHHVVEMWVPNFSRSKRFGASRVAVDVPSSGIAIGWWLRPSRFAGAEMTVGPVSPTAVAVLPLDSARHDAIFPQPRVGFRRGGRPFTDYLKVGSDPELWMYQPQTTQAGQPWWFPGWQPDPTRRHQWRYWTGERWTRSVSDHGTNSVDPQPQDPLGQRRRTFGLRAALSIVLIGLAIAILIAFASQFW